MSILTVERLKDVLKYDQNTGDFYWNKIKHYRFKVGDKAGSINKFGHIQIKFDNKIHYAHRLAWLYIYGIHPQHEIDHINGNSSDNRIENLRDCQHHQNLLNRPKQKNNTSGYKNVYWAKTMNKWMVRIKVNKIDHVKGYFDCVEDANEYAIYLRNKLQKEFSVDNRSSI